MAASSNIADIGNLELLKEEKNYPSYGMPDINNFVLDGSKSIMPNDVQYPYLTESVSDKECHFTQNPKLVITFAHPHTSSGLTLYFVDDYPVLIKITWYTLAGTKLVSQEYQPESLSTYCPMQVDNYGKIEVEFLETRLPGQRIVCRYIKYGTAIKWAGETIQSATVVEEVDLTSASIPINTATLSIVDENNQFELSNHDGVWKSIQKRQEITLTEELADKDIIVGTLFVDTWKSDSNIVTFNLIDRIGLIDKTKFYDGGVYTDEPAGTIIDAIMQSAGVSQYTVANEVRAINVSGYLGICSHREALQQVVFACGAVCNCGRTGEIQIYMPDRYADNTIGIDRQFMGTAVEMAEYVSGVAVTYKTYIAKEETEEVYKDTLPAGDCTIEFSEPVTDLSITGGTVITAKPNYVIVRMEESAECIINGRKYTVKEVTYTKNTELLDAGEEPNIVSFGNCTLVNAERVSVIAEYLLNYYQLRQVVTMSYLLDSEKTGDWVTIADVTGNTLTTALTSQTIDLSGGYIAQANARGYCKVTTDNAYTGEIYAGERGAV